MSIARVADGQAHPASKASRPEAPATEVRLIAVDLDGTLLNSRLEISSANQVALADAAQRGVKIAVVTGRRFHSARRFVEQIPLPVTVISSNGARIGSLSGEVYHRNFLPRGLACEILRAARAHRRYAVAIFDVPGRGQVVMQHGASPDGPLGWYLKNSPEALLETPDLEAALEGDLIQVMFGGPPPEIEAIEPALRDSSAASAVHLTWTKYLSRNVSLLDVMNEGCSKGSALEDWAAREGIGAEQVMAIGDNHNDFEMLRFAGRPVLMANCSADLSRDGCHVTLSNDEDGVAHAIRRYVLDED